ncbi:D-alanyl-D-alanine carboxypeptidase [Streptomyces capoamus]|uniref:D-alanyl-D-alanine carboxypeptidase n=1 Tax=Streptomyces capoamus TaxID=68183 RepID=UPI00339526A4
MAGESPDRSKQRESSAEPTSGSAGSVPEARDPRLAVTREKDAAGGAKDTATKILTVRPDTALHEAVSSWVRAPHADTTADTSGADTGPEDPSEPGDGAGVPSAASATGAEKAGTGAESDTDTDTDIRPAADSDTKPEPDTGEAADNSTTDDTDDTDGKTGAGAEDATDAESAAGDKADAGADVLAGGKGADAGAGAAVDGKGTAGGEGDKADAELGAEQDTDGTSGGDDAGTGSVTDGRSSAAGEDAEADADAEHDAGAEGDADTEDDTDGDADASAKDDADRKAAAGAKDDTDGDADASTEDDADRKAGAGTKGHTDGKAAAGAKDDTDGETDASAEDGADREAGAGAGDGVAGAVGGAVEDEDGSEAADGGDAPQGPPADNDETRTGGAGGKTDAGGEAEAGAARTAAVDQPTAVFKAPRPKKPEVDQPTTMLKLGGKPKAPESDAERTSKFVALKDDLRKPAAPQPAKPRPAEPRPAPDATTPVPQVGPERTTQQPLPPKPPLDLLAELTNTPPPPETPVRTLVRRVKIWTPLVLLLAVVLAVVQAVRPLPAPTLALTGEETYTFEGGRTNLPWPGEGQGWIDADGVGTMGHFGKQTPVAIGSVAKTMTAYIILKHHPLKPGQEGPKIKVDAKAEKEGGYDKAGESTLNTVQAGEYLTQKQALSAVLIPSANNIARLLARWDVGSEAAFVKEMNATARELGMSHTTYTDPSGLKETTVSTAEDQVKLGRAFVKVPALVSISSAASWTDPSGHFWPNYNELPYRIGAIGIKTGSTTAAGGNLLFASRKQVGGRTVTLVGAILGQHKPKILETVNAVSKTALLAAQDALTTSKILKKGDVVGYVDDRLGGHTPVVVTRDVTAAGWSGLKVRLSFTPGTVPHTAKAGTRVGTLTVGDGTSGAVKVPVALQKDLAEPGFGAKLTRLG